jgi:hypothetical protein|nr:MAG TPA: hypothetical protein [Caudoviricetes sp.]
MATLKLSKIKSVEFYRNIPSADQVSGISLFKRLFPFHFQKVDMVYRFTLWIELPFIGAKVKILK